MTQKAGTAGCVSDSGSAGACADVTGISDPHAIVISPDGTSAYSASFSDDAIAIFDRNPSTGALTQLKGLRKGTHRFSVVAVDAAGNTDPTAATDGFKVKRKKRSP